jgi:lipoprotein-releasing system ATP-binding protein
MSDRALPAAPSLRPPISAPRTAVLALEHVTRVFEQGAQRLEVFRDVTAHLSPGEIVALVGPSGSGKSSLLHICGLLESPSEGEVYINGRGAGTLTDVERTAIRRDEIGFVYQFHHLLPEFDALENLVIPQMIAGRKFADAQSLGTRLLTLVGLKDRLTHRPARLSGGEQQRVAIARALVNQPKLLLADEPTGNLDPKTANHVFQILVEICRTRAVSVLIATHNLQMATKMDRTWLLHDGRLIDAGKLQA